jgi:hypothetical protein
MKKLLGILLVLIVGLNAQAQNNVYGKKVVALDSLVSDTIRARTQAAPYIEGFGAGIAGSNTEIQFNDNGVFGASSSLTFDGSVFSSSGDIEVGDGLLLGSTSSSVGSITARTSDAADNATIRIGGGGAISSSRGGFIQLAGNESGITGQVNISAGNVAGGSISMTAGGSQVFLAERLGDVTVTPILDFVVAGTTDTDSLYVSGNANVVGNADFDGNIVITSLGKAINNADGSTVFSGAGTNDIISAVNLNTGDRLVLLCSAVASNGADSSIALVVVDAGGVIEVITEISDDGGVYNWTDNSGALAIDYTGGASPTVVWSYINFLGR